MAMLTLFKATLPSINYIFKNGKPAIFIHGRFSTDVPSEVAELKEEIAARHPHIYIDPEELEVNSEFIDPIEIMKTKLREELRAEMLLATDKNNDRGTTLPVPLRPASSEDVAPISQGGSGAVARLINLSK